MNSVAAKRLGGERRPAFVDANENGPTDRRAAGIGDVPGRDPASLTRR